MNFYIVSNHQKESDLLKEVIETNFDNSVLGITDNPRVAYDDVMRLSVDIMFINLKITPVNGITLIKRIQVHHHHPHFIIFGKNVSDEDKNEAYLAGADLVLLEPLNKIELKRIVNLITENIEMSKRLLKILDLVSGAANHNSEHFSYKLKMENKANSILNFLGIAGGVGTSDIKLLVKMMIEERKNYESLDIMQIYKCNKEGKKVILQQIRRELKKAINNLASMCNEYSDDDLILEYANNLFGFTNVRDEMMFIKGQRKTGGKINIQHFFDGLVQECNKE